MASWNVAPLGEPFDEYASIAGEALQYYDPEIWKTYIRRVGPENMRGVLNSRGRLAGGLAFYRMGQWYGGKCIPTAGVSGVAIDPAARGQGACKTLLVELLKELHRERMPLASLYASTQHLYRTVGFEQSGHNFTYSLPMSSLRTMDGRGRLPINRVTAPDFRMLETQTELRARCSNGNLQRTEGLWERIFEPIGQSTSTYILGDPNAPAGFATLLHGSRGAGVPQPLTASDWVANTPEALQCLITLILDHRSMCDCFRWNGGPQDPLLLAAAEQNVKIVGHLRTLSRVVCFKEALVARGYSTDAFGELHFSVTDELLSENEGRWLMRIKPGSVEVERGGQGLIRLDIRFAAPLFCAMESCSSLVAAGHIACDDDKQTRLADTVFAGPSPWTCEIF